MIDILTQIDILWSTLNKYFYILIIILILMYCILLFIAYCIEYIGKWLTFSLIAIIGGIGWYIIYPEVFLAFVLMSPAIVPLAYLLYTLLFPVIFYKAEPDGKE